MSPGFHDDIPEADYHADRDSLSQSGAKLILKAPALYRHALDNPERNDAFDYGTAAHSLVLGIGAETVVLDYPDWRSKDAREAREEARNDGKTPLLKADWLKVCAMADKLAEHTLAMRLLSHGRPEVSAYAPDEETGVLRRCRFDWLGTNTLSDYKTASSVNPVDLAGRYGSVKKWGYDMQAAWYLDVARALGHPAKAFAFIFQMKEPPHLVTVATLDEDDLWDARERNACAIATYAECAATDTWPGFIPDDTAAVLSLTHQSYIEEQVA